ncbi:hypothetical protein CYLTODRAFT_382302 [Cylindrobasidium torrendii FP15055 ss-10]|uniref:RING-14 protein n=1 Tax=Cylindrobasidium torrendii FP15055 ss-10 TaxID=1314674 RepID=A0A0D7AYX8_9AGAR|nr:hypothetical protein CYLTODRAFT_382302 [Cylindrobasidium torrendii FP15055 ss-10]
MHFSKTYAQLLEALPPELRENAVQYRQLKKLIHKIVLELATLGLTPRDLQELLNAHNQDAEKMSRVLPDGYSVVYELNEESNRIEPCLRFTVTVPDERNRIEEIQQIPPDAETPADTPPEDGAVSRSLLAALEQRRAEVDTGVTSTSHEIVIPLVSDSAFFDVLSSTLESISRHLLVVQQQFNETLKQLSRAIASSARPASESSTAFKPYSVLKDPGTIHAPPRIHNTDLNAWREIFQLYVEAEVFESMQEQSRGEWDMEETEQRLTKFAERVTTRGLTALKFPESRAALNSFLELNIFILNIKKFQVANSEATRKILKKHAKRTALALPSTISGHERLALITHSNSVTLPRALVQAISEILLPVVPPLDDYACLICTAIAFKPIRLTCGHLFCVRCLVKMQKRGQGSCPMCRAPTVLRADRSNVDWALLNFMQDWFPEEAREKLKQNEKEAAEEELRELGIDPAQTCMVM